MKGTQLLHRLEETSVLAEVLQILGYDHLKLAVIIQNVSTLLRAPTAIFTEYTKQETGRRSGKRPACQPCFPCVDGFAASETRTLSNL